MFTTYVPCPILIVSSVIILVFITISLWLAANIFAETRSVQRFLHNSVLINRSLCVFYVVAIVVVDIFHGKRFIFRHTSLSIKLLCQGLQVIFSSGFMMSNISIFLLDHIVYMAVSRMQFDKNNAHGIVKNILCLMNFLVITIFSLTAYVPDLLYSDHHLCGAAIGMSGNSHALSVAGPVLLSIGIILSLTHSIYTYTAILRNAHSSGKSVQTMTSTKIEKQRAQLFKLLKTLSHFTVFRSLECMPIICVVFMEIHGTDVSVETQLMSIHFSIALGCVCSTIPLVWYPYLRQSNKWAALPWARKLSKRVRS